MASHFQESPVPSDRIAEWVLTLVTAPDRAASAVGDLMEDAVARGRLWFWVHVARTALTLLWRGLTVAPVGMTGYAVIAWFVYMLMVAILSFGGSVLVTLLWGMGYFLTHHTGLELLANLLRVRFDWPPLPTEFADWVELLVIGIVAPVQVGRFTARCWPGREAAAWVVMSLLWPFMVIYIPCVGMFHRASLPMVPVIQTFVLVGMLWERRVPSPAELKPN